MRKKTLLGLCTMTLGVMVTINSYVITSNATENNTVIESDEEMSETDRAVGVHEGKVMLNEKNFPDATLRELISRYADEDGYITITDVTSISVYDLRGNKTLGDITGIEYFTSLVDLDLREQKIITNFDASIFPELEYLNLCECNLETLNVKNNSNLKYLYCDDNNLKEINITGNIILEVFQCANNELTELDLSKNIILRQIYIKDNNIGNLDLTGLNNIQILDCSNCNLDELDLNGFNTLDLVVCSNNNLKTLDVSKHANIRYVDCDNNELTELIIGDVDTIERINCSHNQLTTLDLSDNPLVIANCEFNPIKILNISNTGDGEDAKFGYGVSVDYDTLEKLITTDNDYPQLRLFVNTVYEYNDISKIENYKYALVDDENYNEETKMYKVDDSKSIKYYYDSKYGELRIYPDGVTPLSFVYNNYVSENPEQPKIYPAVTTTYHTHIQSYGDTQGTKKNGEMAGTSGKAKRLENIWIDVEGNDNLGIQYTTHCQSYGWMPWSSDGEINGTSGEAKRLEAIKIQLTGEDAEHYDVYYRVHAQSYGWLGWAKNGEASGTSGYAKRLEGIQVVVLSKDSDVPGITYADVTGSSTNKPYYSKDNTVPTVSGADTTNVTYRTHVQSYGWQGWKYNGAMSGTSGEAKRLEGIEIKLTNTPYSGDIVYTTHVQKYGWQGEPDDTTRKDWKKNGDMSGTSGEAKRLEAICIDLTGEMAEHYDIYYRVHAQSYGWLGWAKNGEEAGTAGYAKRLEGIQVILVKEGELPPATYQGVTSIREEAYIQK